MNDLKIGIIGAGGRGYLAQHAHRPGAGSRITAACDLSEPTLAKVRALYGTELYTTHCYEELLQRDLDAVFITVPDYLHEEVAIAALRAGKAVYLEKPMAITTAGCDRILQAAHETKTRLFVGHNMRHMPFVIQMKSLIDSGAIGEVKAIWCRHFVGHGGDYYFTDWHAERRYSTGLLLQKAAHDIDIIHWLAGGYSIDVNAMGALTLYDSVSDRLPETDGPRIKTRKPPGELTWPPLAQKEFNAKIDVEDLSMMQMRLDNGVFASYQQCHYTPDYWRNYTVIGTQGRIENFGNGEDGTVIRLWNRRHDASHPAGDEVFPIAPATGDHGGADPRIVAEFLHFVREGGRTQTSPFAARQSVAAGCAATESLRHGGIPQAISPLSPELIQYFDEGQTVRYLV